MSNNTKNKAIFLDRDGTLNEDHGYVHKIADFQWLPNVISALKIFKSLGYLLIVVSNQSGIARNYYTQKDLLILQADLDRQLQKENSTIDGWYYCPHHPEITGPCLCRKPKPGLLLEAMAKHLISPNESWMIGDRLRDVQAGIAAHVPSIKLGANPSSADEDLAAKKLNCPVFPNLITAAQFIECAVNPITL
ncbi:MAG: HAD family hydrolase [Desulfovibrionaceae bacterium]|nr:HAD family hydrolase [Desulfovibrionaceae bacterium]